jgi:hypothetical protein
MVHHPVQKHLPAAPVISHINQEHTTPSSQLRLGLPRGTFVSGFLTETPQL